MSNLLPSITESGKGDNQIAADMYKIIIENGAPTVRVKNGKDDVLVKEWIGIQNELQIIKRDRIEEDKRKLQIAGQQALREMVCANVLRDQYIFCALKNIHVM